MNAPEPIKWSLRLENVVDGRTFITDRTIVLDEAYFPASELETATPEQIKKTSDILSTPTSVEFELDDLVPSAETYNFSDAIRLAPRCIDFLKTLSFHDKLRFAVAPAEDPLIHIFDGELLIGSMTPMTFPHERSENGRREFAKQRVADIPSGIVQRAEQGDPAAFPMMAFCYGRVYALCKDYGVEYLQWTTRAAESGDKQSQYYLAGMYFRGDVVSQNDAEAFRWYRKAADQNHPDAAWRAGIMLGIGIGTEKDPVSGLQLVEKAIDLGSKKAIKIRTFMRGKLSKDDMTKVHNNLIQLLENKT